MKHLEERELELEVWEDRELDFIEFVLWSDAQLLNSLFGAQFLVTSGSQPTWHIVEKTSISSAAQREDQN